MWTTAHSTYKTCQQHRRRWGLLIVMQHKIQRHWNYLTPEWKSWNHSMDLMACRIARIISTPTLMISMTEHSFANIPDGNNAIALNKARLERLKMEDGTDPLVVDLSWRQQVYHALDIIWCVSTILGPNPNKTQNRTHNKTQDKTESWNTTSWWKKCLALSNRWCPGMCWCGYGIQQITYVIICIVPIIIFCPITW